MKLHELIVLQEILEREQGAAQWEIDDLKEKIQELEDKIYAAEDEKKKTSLTEELDFYKRERKRKLERKTTITLLLDLVNNTEFTLG